MGERLLVVTADDFGIGPETSRGILDVAARGVVSSTVLLVNSPHAASAVRLWQSLGRPVELGWHPCLTLDGPVCPPERVPSLVRDDGTFHPLGAFLKRMVRGRIAADEVFTELAAQYDRFVDWVGAPPPAVNGHHHIHVFPVVRQALNRLFADRHCRPFVRRVRESWLTWLRVPGGRLKRGVLNWYGRRATDHPGADALLGITAPNFVDDERFFERWLRRTPGRRLELTCHPGYADNTLIGRDGVVGSPELSRRPAELARLRDPRFLAAVAAAGFTIVSAREMLHGPRRAAA